MGQKTSSEGYKCVEEMKVGWGVQSCVTRRAKRSYMCMIKGVWKV